MSANNQYECLHRPSVTGVAALSYLDQINLGILSDPATYPDIDVFCDGVRTALAILQDHTRRTFG